MNIKDAIEFVTDTAFGHREMLELLNTQAAEIEELRDKAILLKRRLDKQVEINKEMLKAREVELNDKTSINSQRFNPYQ